MWCNIMKLYEKSNIYELIIYGICKEMFYKTMFLHIHMCLRFKKKKLLLTWWLHRMIYLELLHWNFAYK